MPYREDRCPKCHRLASKYRKFAHCFECRETARLELADQMELFHCMEEGRQAEDEPAHNNPYPKGTKAHKAWCEGWAETFAPHEDHPAARPHAAYKRSDILYHGDIFGGNR